MPSESFTEISLTTLSEELGPFSNSSLEVLNGTLDCGRRLESEDYRFWIEGISVAIIGSAGFLGNLLTLIVLSRPHLRDVFHTLLFALACFDLLFIVFGGINYTFRTFNVSADAYTYLFPYVVYPMTHIAVAGTIFMTMAISIERYLGLCYPLSPIHKRKAWMYILPVIIISVILNVPKFFEIKVRMEYDKSTGLEVPVIANTQLRLEKTYVLGYIMWTRLIVTGVIPVTALIYLNFRIVFDLMKSTKVQRFGSARRHNKERNLSFVLLCIVLIFFCCHASRIYLDIYEFANVNRIIDCRPFPWWPSDVMQIMVFLSHLLMILNSSVNFVVYCLVGQTFRKEMFKLFGMKKYARVPGALSRRSSRNDFPMSQSTSANRFGQGFIASNTQKLDPVANLPLPSGCSTLKPQMPDVVENQIESLPSIDKISLPEIETDSSPKIVKSAMIISPKAVDSFLDLESKCSAENLKDILLPEEGDEEADVATQSLLEKFTENKSLILV